MCAFSCVIVSGHLTGRCDMYSIGAKGSTRARNRLWQVRVHTFAPILDIGCSFDRLCTQSSFTSVLTESIAYCQCMHAVSPVGCSLAKRLIALGLRDLTVCDSPCPCRSVVQLRCDLRRNYYWPQEILLKVLGDCRITENLTICDFRSTTICFCHYLCLLFRHYGCLFISILAVSCLRRFKFLSFFVDVFRIFEFPITLHYGIVYDIMSVAFVVFFNTCWL
jgi:hypothetical protein